MEDPQRSRRARIARQLPVVVRIALLCVTLFMIVFLAKPCSQGVANFVGNFDESPQKLPATESELDLSNATVITPDMSDEQVSDAIKEARRKAAEVGAERVKTGDGASTAGSAESSAVSPDQ